MRTSCLLILLAACVDEPPTLDDGVFRVDVRSRDTTCSTEPVAIDGGWSCPTGSFHAVTPIEQSEARGDLECGDPLDPERTWSIAAVTHNHDVLGLVDTEYGWTDYQLYDDDVYFEAEADGASFVAEGDASDSLEGWSRWTAFIEVQDGRHFTATLDVDLETVLGEQCRYRYDLVGVAGQ